MSGTFHWSMSPMAAKLDGGVISDVRMACGAVQCTPRRLFEVEDLIKGETPGEEIETLVTRIAASGAKAAQLQSLQSAADG